MTTSSLSPRARWTTLGAVLVIGVALDQIAKQLAHAHLRGRGLVPVVEGFFELRYARNPGAFFSLGANLEPDLRRVLFVSVSILAVALITRLYAKAQKPQVALRWALLFLLAGAFGNLVDRVLYGEVIDFAHLYWEGVFDWATFNVADVFIVAGVVLLAVDLLRSESTANPPPAGEHPDQDAPPSQGSSNRQEAETA